MSYGATLLKFTETKLYDLIEKIKGNIVGFDKLLVIIDLNLVTTESRSSKELFMHLQTGIAVKTYIEDRLNVDENKKIKFLFISQYLELDTGIKKQLVELMNGTPWVATPAFNESGKDILLGSGTGRPQRECHLLDDNPKKKLIMSYYSKMTTYADLIGKIFETVFG